MKIIFCLLMSVAGVAAAGAALPNSQFGEALVVGGLNSVRAAASSILGSGYGPDAGTDRNAFKFAEVGTRPIADVISTTGTLAPVALVTVSSQVSGQIRELHADFNSEVKQGDVIARFDPVTFQNALIEAEAELAIANANVLKVQIAVREADSDLLRKRALFAGGSGSLLEQNKSTATRDLAAATLMEANATVRKTEAAVGQARSNLERATIRSPINGTVIHRSIEIGQIIAASLTAPTLFTIAQDLSAMKLDALIAEGDIGRVQVGQRVSFTVDTYADRTFSGTVAQIRKQPQSSQNVVIYTVVVTTPNPERLLLPGMTATTRIVINERPPALAVPNAALRAKVPDAPASASPRVFVEREGRAVPVAVRLLGADASFTQVASDELRPGDRIVVGLTTTAPKPAASRGLIGGF